MQFRVAAAGGGASAPPGGGASAAAGRGAPGAAGDGRRRVLADEGPGAVRGAGHDQGGPVRAGQLELAPDLGHVAGQAAAADVHRANAQRAQPGGQLALMPAARNRAPGECGRTGCAPAGPGAQERDLVVDLPRRLLPGPARPPGWPGRRPGSGRAGTGPGGATGTGGPGRGVRVWPAGRTVARVAGPGQRRRPQRGFLQLAADRDELLSPILRRHQLPRDPGRGLDTQAG